MTILKYTLAMLLLGLLPFFAQAQDYYIQKDDAGLNTAPYQDSLEQHAKDLVFAIPEGPLRDAFRVYGFGFYQHSEVTDGYPAAFEKMRTQIASETPYYLIFGKQTDETGVYTRFWVDLKLPEEGVLACYSTMQRALLRIKMYEYANAIYSKSAVEYANTEMEVMDSLQQKILKIIDCCNSNNNNLGCSQCPTEDEIYDFFRSGLHGRYFQHNIFITDSLSNPAKGRVLDPNIEDYAKVLFHWDDLSYVPSYAEAEASIRNLNDDPNRKSMVFVTKNEDFCDPVLFNKILNEFNESNFFYAYHTHFFKNKGCTDATKSCDFMLSKDFWKKKRSN
jgi:hypothetical protein